MCLSFPRRLSLSPFLDLSSFFFLDSPSSVDDPYLFPFRTPEFLSIPFGGHLRLPVFLPSSAVAKSWGVLLLGIRHFLFTINPSLRFSFMNSCPDHPAPIFSSWIITLVGGPVFRRKAGAFLDFPRFDLLPPFVNALARLLPTKSLSELLWISTLGRDLDWFAGLFLLTLTPFSPFPLLPPPALPLCRAPGIKFSSALALGRTSLQDPLLTSLYSSCTWPPTPPPPVPGF